MLSVPFKLRPENAQRNPAPLEPALRSHIANAYAENPDNYAADLKSLESLRVNLSSLDTSESLIPQLLTLALTLEQVALKFPVDEEHIKICFSWVNVFGSAAGSIVSSFDLGVERAAIYFNLGALCSQLGARADLESIDGLKRACTFFQTAAGCFEKIKLLVDTQSSISTIDFSEPVLDMLISAMLAQAQEMFYEKARIDKLKHGTMAKLACAAKQLFSKAYTSALAANLSVPSSSEYLLSLQTKSAYFCAVTEHHYATVCHDESRYGEQVGRLHSASTELKSAMSRKGISTALSAKVKTLANEVDLAYSAAKKDNDVIYMELVPKKEDIPVLPPPAVMVKASLQLDVWLPPSSPFSSHNNSSNIIPFASLMPLALHKASSVYSALADDLIRTSLDQMQDAADVAQATLQSLNLPSAIDSLDFGGGGNTLPQVIAKKVAEVHEQGGIAKLEEIWVGIVQEREQCLLALDEATRMLDIDESQDLGRSGELRSTSSNSAVARRSALREVGRTHLEKLGAAKRSDGLVRGKLDASYSALTLLSSSMADIMANLPTHTTAVLDPQTLDIVERLKAALLKLSNVLDKQSDIADKLKAVRKADDIGPILSAAMNDKRDVEGEALFRSESTKYSKVINVVEAWVKSIGTIMDDIVDLNETFSKWKLGNEGLKKREEVLQNLEEAHRVFKDVGANLIEGGKFYFDFNTIIMRYNQTVQEFATSRMIERRENLQTQTQSASTMNGNHRGPQVNYVFNPNPPTSMPPPTLFPYRS